jgi:hypothetical protein
MAATGLDSSRKEDMFKSKNVGGKRRETDVL